MTIPSTPSNQWTQEQIKSLTSEEIRLLSETQISGLSTAQLQWFEKKQVAVFTAEQLLKVNQSALFPIKLSDTGFFEKISSTQWESLLTKYSELKFMIRYIPETIIKRASIGIFENTKIIAKLGLYDFMTASQIATQIDNESVLTHYDSGALRTMVEHCQDTQKVATVLYLMYRKYKSEAIFIDSFSLQDWNFFSQKGVLNYLMPLLRTDLGKPTEWWTPPMIEALSLVDIKRLTEMQIHELGRNLLYFSEQQLSALEPWQIQTLTRAQIRDLFYRVNGAGSIIKSISMGKLNAMTARQWVAFDEEQREEILDVIGGSDWAQLKLETRSILEQMNLSSSSLDSVGKNQNGEYGLSDILQQANIQNITDIIVDGTRIPLDDIIEKLMDMAGLNTIDDLTSQNINDVLRTWYEYGKKEFIYGKFPLSNTIAIWKLLNSTPALSDPNIREQAVRFFNLLTDIGSKNKIKATIGSDAEKLIYHFLTSEQVISTQIPKTYSDLLTDPQAFSSLGKTQQKAIIEDLVMLELDDTIPYPQKTVFEIKIDYTPSPDATEITCTTIGLPDLSEIMRSGVIPASKIPITIRLGGTYQDDFYEIIEKTWKEIYKVTMVDRSIKLIESLKNPASGSIEIIDNEMTSMTLGEIAGLLNPSYMEQQYRIILAEKYSSMVDTNDIAPTLHTIDYNQLVTPVAAKNLYNFFQLFRQSQSD